MTHRLFFAFLLSLSVLCCGGIAMAASSELSERLKQAEVELKNARESLHVAHQELGEKSDEIRRLEKALKKSPAARRQKGNQVEEVSRLKRELQNANARIRSLEKAVEMANAADGKRQAVVEVAAKVVSDKEAEAGKAEVEKAGAEKAEAKKAVTTRVSDAPEAFRVVYDLNSAASLAGREKALQWVRSKLGENPGSKFEIRGKANDREFKETNLTIAENRARFLASFLRVSGVPASAIIKVSGSVSEDPGASGRIVEVLSVP